MNENPLQLFINITLMAMATTLLHTSNAHINHPLVIIPGSGGNQLEARLSKEYRPSSLFCRLITTSKKKGGWFRLWFNPTVLLAPFTRCFAERMTLFYDESSPTLFGSKSLVNDTSNNKSYSAKDTPEFLTDIGFEKGVYLYRTRVRPLVSGLSDPGVSVTCMIGCRVDTPEALVYGSGGFDVQPDVVYGDGTVNLASLWWLESEFSGVKVFKIPGVSHTSILKEDAAVKKIIEEILEINSVALSSAV